MSGSLNKVGPNRYTRFLKKVDHHSFDPQRCWEWRGAQKGNPIKPGTINQIRRGETWKHISRNDQCPDA